jgi:hypothetical protein
MDLGVQVDLSLDHYAKAHHARSKTWGAIESMKPPMDGPIAHGRPQGA